MRLIKVLYFSVKYIRLVYFVCLFFGKNISNRTDYLLALATLGDTTKNRKDPISSVAPPKVAKAGEEGTISRAVSH
jgi:hypothetical protein